MVTNNKHFQKWKLGKKVGKYIIKEKIGEGGFGITYRATYNENSQVVIKTLKSDIQNDYNFNDFSNEAIRLSRGYTHDNIVKVIEMFDVEGMKGIVMEYVKGASLFDLIKNDTLSLSECLTYISQIGNALEFMHTEIELIHRDAHPKNIIIKDTKEGKKAILIDFGLSRDINDKKNKTPLGLKGYAPIEQLQGDGNQGAFTDVYILAATLYYVLTKTTPMDAGNRVKMINGKIQLDFLTPPQQYNPKIGDRRNFMATPFNDMVC